jgi:thioredoxin-related protein
MTRLSARKDFIGQLQYLLLINLDKYSCTFYALVKQLVKNENDIREVLWKADE